jgi:DNA-binding GntR family transcriptional regulator
LDDAPQTLPSLVRTEPRRTSLDVHAHLRRLILDGTLPPGTELKQAELARMLEVSRTPLREAFRMLQEEGLIDADVNARGRVTGFDGDELDALYAARILLEGLGVRITAGRLSREEAQDVSARLHDMDRAQQGADPAAWADAHRCFHRLLNSRSGAALIRSIASYAERSERYVRAVQTSHPDSVERGRQEHYELFVAVLGGDGEQASRLAAAHLSRTAFSVMADHAPGHDAYAVRSALAMVSGPPQDGTPAGGR